MIKIIGTSHVAKSSVNEVHRVIEKLKPDCVAVELCPARFYTLLEGPRKPSLGFGLTQFLLSYLQQYLGKKIGIMPGAEMLEAINAAKKAGSKVVLIDMRIEQILMRISGISKREKIRLFSKLIFGFVLSPFSKESFDISKVPSKRLIKKAMGYMKKELPVFYDILVTQRNKYMARNILSLSKKYEKIVVVVGAGHEDGLKKLLNKKPKSLKG